MAKYHITSVSSKFYQNYGDDCEIKRDLLVEYVEKGIILPSIETKCDKDVAYRGGVVNRDGDFVQLSATRRNSKYKSQLEGYAFSKTEYCDETVIYGGILYAFFGHVLLESLSRLWYYIKSKQQGVNYRVVFNIVPGAKGKFKEFFELLDIPYNNYTFIEKPTQYKNVIIPEQASVYATCWHKDFTIPFNYMASQVEASKYSKIYFTRTKLLERNPVAGELPIERIFAQNGYKIVSPERLSLREQISLMKGCNELVTVSSSTYHNLLFANDNTKLVCLNRSLEPDTSQFIVDYAKKLDVTFVDVCMAPIPTGHVHGPWIIGITPELRQFCKERGIYSKLLELPCRVSNRAIYYFFSRYSAASYVSEHPFDLKTYQFCAERFKAEKPTLSIKQFFKNILTKLTFGRFSWPI